MPRMRTSLWRIRGETELAFHWLGVADPRRQARLG
jgi:hypothetical protein